VRTRVLSDVLCLIGTLCRDYRQLLGCTRANEFALKADKTLQGGVGIPEDEM